MALSYIDEELMEDGFKMTSFFIWAICSYFIWGVIHTMNPDLKLSFIKDKTERIKWILIALVIGTFPALFITSAMGLGR